MAKENPAKTTIDFDMNEPITKRIPLPHGRDQRSYLVHTPTGVGPWPVVMMLHGAGGTAEFAVEETGWSHHAAKHGFVVVYPEGVAVDPKKEPKFLTNPQEWNDGSGRGRADDVAFLLEVLHDLPNWANVNLSQVAITGFSNGAGMAFRLASSHPNRFRAIAPVAGHCWFEPPILQPIPTLYMIGKDDPILPLHGGTARTPWGRFTDRPAVEQTLSRWSRAINTPTNTERFPVYLIENLGHHWPGGAGKLGEKLGGPITSEVNATNVIWEFFAKAFASH